MDTLTICNNYKKELKKCFKKNADSEKCKIIFDLILICMKNNYALQVSQTSGLTVN